VKVTYNWLKDFVNINIPARTLAEKLTMAGLEVTFLEEQSGDWVFEIEVTSNRTDWLSISGIAREIAAITGSRFSLPPTQLKAAPLKRNEFTIEIEDSKDCPLYVAKIIRQIKVTDSPSWLKNRLELVGVRSVNNIVDITNYVMMESGQPLHAFDLNKLAGSGIIVRRAKDKEALLSIDGKSRVLDNSIMVIADAHRPVAIAGVMGGMDTEVGVSTTDILLESAYFAPVLIRRMRQKLGMQSESSYRFERGVNPQTVETASLTATALIKKTGGCQGVYALASGRLKQGQLAIDFNVGDASRVLGVAVTADKIKKIFRGLGFTVSKKSNKLLGVKVPAHRPDVRLQEDLIEEAGRIFGFDKIPSTLPAIVFHTGTDTCLPAGRENRKMVCDIKNMLCGLGLNEVITYSLMERQLAQGAGFFRKADFEILNPLSKEQEMLRPSLLPGLLQCTKTNLNRKQECVNIFEISKVFADVNGSDREVLNLGVALSGERKMLFTQGLVREEVSLLHIKGIIETLFERLGIKEYRLGQGASEVEIIVAGKLAGYMTEAGQGVKDIFGIKNKRVVLAELFLEEIIAQAATQKKYQPLPLYPGITRDISILVKESQPVAEVLRDISENGAPLLKGARVTDYYKGKQVAAGFKGITVSCDYGSNERTLTEAEINPLHSKILNSLREKFGIQIR